MGGARLYLLMRRRRYWTAAVVGVAVGLVTYAGSSLVGHARAMEIGPLAAIHVTAIGLPNAVAVWARRSYRKWLTRSLSAEMASGQSISIAEVMARLGEIHPREEIRLALETFEERGAVSVSRGWIHPINPLGA